MLKARNKKLSLLIVFAMLMTMFAGIGTAGAAEAITYSGVNVPVVQTSSALQNVDAQVLINVSDAIVFDRTYDSIVTAKLPSNVEITKQSDLSIRGTGALFGKVNAVRKSSQAVDITVTKGAYTGEEKILLTFENLKIKSGSGDIVASFLAPSGSAFPPGSVTIARIATGGKVNVLAGTVKNIGDGESVIDSITLAEATAGVLEKNEVIKFELSKGFEWVQKPTIAGGWAFEGLNSLAGDFSITEFDDNIMEVTNVKAFGKSTAGRISIGTDLNAPVTVFATIQAKDDAKEGDVTVTVSSKNISKTKVVVAKYGSYKVSVTEGTTEEVIAGRTEQEIGEFNIEEAIAGSLVEGRTIILDLPSGVKWVKDSGGDPEINPDIVEGSVELKDVRFVTGSKDRSIRMTVSKTSDEASKIVFKDAEVKVDPGFKGDIEVTVRGTAGAEGTVKVAEAKLPVTISAKNATKIVTGAANQKVADIIIKENIEEAILDTAENDSNMIVVGLDEGYKFSKKPTVEVTEGDLVIDSTKLIENDEQFRIVVKYSSDEPSTITISDVYVTAYRYVPEGEVKATLVEVDEYGTTDATGSTALVDFNTDKSAGSTAIATCVTPAETDTVSAQFVISSNIYNVNGVSKVMDAAPYIKGDRTYVPVRYLAYALGVAEADVVWDEATQKVTLTKGDDVVEMTIGSTTITVNGEAQTMDVAPEISNGRTMLPARYVAEGFGYVVGWDAGTRTVLISQ